MPQPPSRPRPAKPLRPNPRQRSRSTQPPRPRRDASPWQRFLPPFLRTETTSLEQRLGQILVVLGVGTIVGVVGILPTVNRLHCDREGPYISVCRLRSFSLVGLPVRSIALNPLQGAQPEPNPATAGYSTRILLLSQAGRRVPLSVYGTTWATCDRGADRINRFLGNPDLDSFTFWDLVPAPLLLTTLVGGGSLSLAGVCLLWIAQAKTPIRKPDP
ncbi:MAG: hypothetical protein ACO4CG_11510 [Prochlorothrix sp.]|nr:hypothetical protein [Prochlorothrix sp.]